MKSTVRLIFKAFTPPIIIDGIRYLRDSLQRIPPSKVDSGVIEKSFDHRKAVGGMWDEIGKLQLTFLVDHGLQPCHKLLDVGCGCLRGGVHFIEYLNNGNYYGIDASQSLIDVARQVELPRYGLADRTVNLLCRADFDFSKFGTQFDYAIAQSVFTHLPWNSIQRCLVNAKKVLKDNGRFFVTFFEDPDGSHYLSTITHNPGGIVTYPDKDPYHYEFGVFKDLAERVGLEVDYVGDWNHPRHQMMMVFSRPSEPHLNEG